ncbi:interleukin-22 [Cynoglossus semilaevis]|uniref:Uncharacterized LOC103382505 n=1 Tax=Cynoglossus semilaevis TaxID=244447 RepID=A0A3P8UTJ8_CYNSE|nr:uncharacterized protein LOC103382505 [Cynoglossus semilaevis]XP_024913197.1 uncharacterized protein LOC103382505 [Cynoglossus semilaevis]
MMLTMFKDASSSSSSSSSSSCFSSRLATLLLLVLSLFLIGWVEHTVALPTNRHLSPVLRNKDTYQAVHEVSKHFQGLETADESSTKLLPNVDRNKDHMSICCLHANILDFYMNNILTHHCKRHDKILRLKVDLARVSEDLQTHGCNVTHYHDDHHAVEFRKKLAKMDGERGIIKAVGEIDILFSFLTDYCVQTKNGTSATTVSA